MAPETRTHLRFRIEPNLQKRLEVARKKSGRTLTAEITERLKQSFDVPDIAKDISSLNDDLWDVNGNLTEIQIQIRAILSHLGLPDPVEEEKARRREVWLARRRKSEDNGKKK
jgi:seryl-tRNA synthetase